MRTCRSVKFDRAKLANLKTYESTKVNSSRLWECRDETLEMCIEHWIKCILTSLAQNTQRLSVK